MTVGGVEYKIFCTVGHSSAYPTLGFSTAKDLKECMQQCGQFPALPPFLLSFPKLSNSIIEILCCRKRKILIHETAAEPKCQGVNYWYGTTCVWATIYQFPPTTPAPGSGAFMCAIPTTKRPQERRFYGYPTMGNFHEVITRKGMRIRADLISYF